jgi:hypothetical protein
MQINECQSFSIQKHSMHSNCSVFERSILMVNSFDSFLKTDLFLLVYRFWRSESLLFSEKFCHFEFESYSHKLIFFLFSNKTGK